MATLPPAPDIDDSFLFVRAVIRFSLNDGRPHWPGYPVYVWVGKLIAAVTGDPVLALHLLSAGACALAAWPLAVVAREWGTSLGLDDRQAGWAGGTAAALWLATPMSWVSGSQIVSDPFALLLGTSMLVLCLQADRRGNARAWLAAAVLGGVMLGVRLVNVTMLGPFLWAAWHARKERWRGVPAPLCLALALLGGVAPWAAALWLHEGMAVVYGGRAHVVGHFTQWGESMLTDTRPWMRPVVALNTLVVYGLGFGRRALGVAGVLSMMGWVATLALAARVLATRATRNRVTALIALWVVPNLIYIYVGHDVALPRYLMSAVALCSVVGGLAVARGRAGALAALTTLAATLAGSAHVAALQHREPAPEYSVSVFVSRHPRAAVAVADAPGLPFFLHEVDEAVVWRVLPPEEVPEWRRTWEAEGRPVFTTEVPPVDSVAWRPVAHYCRDLLIDPRLGHDLWLFAPVTAPIAGVVDDCDGGS